jgi:hypothetical protein
LGWFNSTSVDIAQVEIDQFFRAEGSSISIPVKPAKKIAVLQRIASELSPDTKYP